MAAETDGLLLVTRPGITEKAVLETLLEELLDTDDLVLLGTVINAAAGWVAAPDPQLSGPAKPAMAPVPADPRPVDFF